MLILEIVKTVIDKSHTNLFKSVYNDFIKIKDSNNHHHKQIIRYLANIDKFYMTYFLNEDIRYLDIIAYNIINFTSILIKNSTNSTCSNTYFRNFCVFATRVIELAFILQQYKFDDTESSMFIKDHDFFETLLKSKFIEEADELKEQIFIKYSDKEKKTVIYAGVNNKNIYFSNIKFEESSDIDNILEIYLKYTSYRGLSTVYYNKNVNSKKQTYGGQFDNLDPIDRYKGEIYSEDKLVKFNEKQTEEEQLEVILKNKKINDTNETLLENELEIYNEDMDEPNKVTKQNINKLKKDKIKSFFVRKLISHSIVKNNHTLTSKYNIPPLELLADFIKYFYSNDSLEANLIVVEILLGLEHNQIAYFLLNPSGGEVRYTTQKISMDLTNAYGRVDDPLNKLFLNTENKITIQLPSFLQTILHSIQNEIEEKQVELEKKFIQQCKNEFDNLSKIEDEQLLELKSLSYQKKDKDYITILSQTKLNVQEDEDTIISELLKMEEIAKKCAIDTYLTKKLKSFLQKKKRSFSKYIVLNQKILPIISIHYFKQTYKTSSIEQLFLQRKTDNIKTELAYVATKQTQNNTTHWINTLAKKLKLDNVLERDIEHNGLKDNVKYAGANKVLQPNAYKIFINTLQTLNLDSLEDKISVKMMLIRYLLSILIAARKNYQSCNLQVFSRRDKFLMIHEKARDYGNSKRIIPLNQLSIDLINYYYKIRTVVPSIQNYTPVVYVNDCFKPIINSSLRDWIDAKKDSIIEHNNEAIYILLREFIYKVELDFGRHIFNSYAVNQHYVSNDTINGFLDHSMLGTDVQAKYNIFDNKQYFKDIVLTQNDIEKVYIPYLSFLKEDIDDI